MPLDHRKWAWFMAILGGLKAVIRRGRARARRLVRKFQHGGLFPALWPQSRSEEHRWFWNNEMRGIRPSGADDFWRLRPTRRAQWVAGHRSRAYAWHAPLERWNEWPGRSVLSLTMLALGFVGWLTWMAQARVGVRWGLGALSVLAMLGAAVVLRWRRERHRPDDEDTGASLEWWGYLSEDQRRASLARMDHEPVAWFVGVLGLLGLLSSVMGAWSAFHPLWAQPWIHGALAMGGLALFDIFGVENLRRGGRSSSLRYKRLMSKLEMAQPARPLTAAQRAFVQAHGSVGLRAYVDRVGDAPWLHWDTEVVLWSWAERLNEVLSKQVSPETNAWLDQHALELLALWPDLEKEGYEWRMVQRFKALPNPTEVELQQGLKEDRAHRRHLRRREWQKKNYGVLKDWPIDEVDCVWSPRLLWAYFMAARQSHPGLKRFWLESLCQLPRSPSIAKHLFNELGMTFWYNTLENPDPNPDWDALITRAPDLFPDDRRLDYLVKYRQSAALAKESQLPLSVRHEYLTSLFQNFKISDEHGAWALTTLKASPEAIRTRLLHDDMVRRSRFRAEFKDDTWQAIERLAFCLPEADQRRWEQRDRGHVPSLTAKFREQALGELKVEGTPATAAPPRRRSRS